MKRLYLLIALVILCTPLAFPQAAVNVASFAGPKLPNGSLAQGTMFTYFAPNIGPAALATATSFPLPTELGGTSIDVTVGGQTLPCIMIFSIGGQAAAILPSATPLGPGTMTVRFNGQVVSTSVVTVVANSFGIFSINQQGNGPGVFTNTSFVANTVLNAANPGDAWIIWGTGLGAVPGDEAAGPLPGGLPYDVRVFVGGIEAQVVGKSRSGCCAGIDQVAFIVPQGVVGCYVPVYVIVEGVTSNFTTMAIGDSGNFCTDPGLGITPSVLSQVRTNGAVRTGSINLIRQDISIPGLSSSQTPGQVNQISSIVADSISASYNEIDLTGFTQFSGFTDISTIGACNVIQFSGVSAEVEDPVKGINLDAGPSLTATSTVGTEQVPKVNDVYFKNFLTIPGVPSFIQSRVESALTGLDKTAAKDQFTLPEFLNQGNVSVSAPGGTGPNSVSAHTASLNIGPTFEWTNRDSITEVDRSRPLTVTWTGGAPGAAVQIFGFSAHTVTESNTSGALFFCAADGDAGSFPIPVGALQALPPSASLDGAPGGLLQVGGYQQNPFNVSDLDVAIMTHIASSSSIVPYR